MKKLRQKTILIIHYEGNFLNNPSLKCIVDTCLDLGWKVQMRCSKTGKSVLPAYRNVRYLEFGRLFRFVKTLVVDRLSSWFFMRAWVLYEALFVYRTSFAFIVGVDRHGLIEGAILSQITRTPMVFISFEILFEKETSIRFKSLEKRAAIRVAHWIIQDSVRAGCLQKENGFSAHNRFILPLASAGCGVKQIPRLRDELLIPLDKKVAISIGSIVEWAMSKHILESVSSWPEEWVLIMHDRYGQTQQLVRNALPGIKSLIGDRVFLSKTAPALIDEMGGVLNGVSVGLAFYAPDYIGPTRGDNLKFLGMASGKISTYLRYGVPVIMNDIGLAAEAAVANRFGVVLDHPRAIGQALAVLDIQECSENALRYFSKKLDYEIYRAGLTQLFAGLAV